MCQQGFSILAAKAAIATGSDDEHLRSITSKLAQIVTDYKQAAKHARKMKPAAAPKAKGKAKAKAEPAP